MDKFVKSVCIAMLFYYEWLIVTNVFARSPSILKYLRYAELVAGIVNVVALTVALIAEHPCVIVLVEPDVLVSQTSTTLPYWKSLRDNDKLLLHDNL